MKITLAKSAGFCFGVKRAVDTVYEQLEMSATERQPIYTFGPIIHNEEVVRDLEEKRSDCFRKRRRTRRESSAWRNGHHPCTRSGKGYIRKIKRAWLYISGRNLPVCVKDTPPCGETQCRRGTDRDYRK